MSDIKIILENNSIENIKVNFVQIKKIIMNKKSTFLSALLAFFGVIAGANAQCPAGELAVTVDVTTDAYGYELYWEVTPDGSDCGVNTLFSFGNTAVACGGGGLQAQTPGGYGDNVTVTEDLGCMVEGTCVNVYTVDDWGDGGNTIQFYVEGIVADVINCSGTNDTLSFCPVSPALYNAEIGLVHEYTAIPVNQVASALGSSLEVTNTGADAITEVTVLVAVRDGNFDIVYQNYTTPVATIAPGETVVLTDAGYLPSSADLYTVQHVMFIDEQFDFVDAATYTVDVTQNFYARDNDTVSVNLGVGTASAELGNSYDYPVAGFKMDSVLFQFKAGSIGDTTEVKVYEFDGVNPGTQIGTSGLIITTAADTAGIYKTVPVTNLSGGDLNLTTTQVFVVLTDSESGFLGLGHSTAIYTEGKTLGSIGGGPWTPLSAFGFSNPCMIRPYTSEVGTTGLSDLSSGILSIYPNPSVGSFNLNLSGLTDSKVDVLITDVSGKIVMSKPFSLTNGELNTLINISDVEDGIYIVNVNGSQSMVKTIVVSKK